MRWFSVLAAVMAGALLCSCRFIPTADVRRACSGPSQAKAFDPDKMVASEWSAKVIPYFEKRAGPFAEVRISPRNLRRKQAHGSAIGRSLGTCLGRIW